jgi:hypothetical protein
VETVIPVTGRSVHETRIVDGVITPSPGVRDLTEQGVRLLASRVHEFLEVVVHERVASLNGERERGLGLPVRVFEPLPVRLVLDARDEAPGTVENVPGLVDGLIERSRFLCTPRPCSDPARTVTTATLTLERSR